MSTDINTNKISLFVNGLEYTQFTEISVLRDLETMASSFQFAASNEFSSDFPFKAFDDCIIEINSVPVITGFINGLNPSYSNSNHIVNISGYDMTKDVIDTEIYTDTEISEATTFSALITQIMQSHGITGISVINNAGEISLGDSEDYTAGETGTTLFEYFLSIAKKKQVLLNTDGLGNIVIYRNIVPDRTSLNLSNIRSGSNEKIKSAAFDIDYSNRYKTIIVKSQSFDDDDISDFATDSEIKKERTKTIISDLVYNEKECKDLAIWEVNRRRADSKKYKCVVAGFWAKENTIFKPNQFFSIQDDYCGLNNTMLLKAVEYKYSKTSGSTAELTFITSDAYTLNENAPNSNDVK